MSFNSIKEEVYSNLEKRKYIVLATSDNNKVTARTVGFITIGNKIYLQTDINFEKCSQIKNNNNVALCVDNIQIVGEAKIVGHPYDENNKSFLDKYSVINKHSVEKYSKMKDEVVIEVMPTFIKVWNYIEGKPVIDYIDIANKVVVRENYDTSNIREDI